MSQARFSADVEAALADADVVQTAARAPVVLIGGEPIQALWANAAALAAFGAANFEDLTRKAIAASDPGAKRLRQLTGLLAVGAPARTERLRFHFDGAPVTLTWRFRRLGPPANVLAAALEANPVAQADALAARPEVSSAEPQDPSVEPEQATAPPDPVSAALERFLGQLMERFQGARTLRFLWRTTKDNRLCEIGAAFCEAIGRPRDSLLGVDLGDLAAQLGLDQEGRLRAALAGRDSWAKIRVLWPVAGVAAALPVSLGAAPAFDANRTFDGWRGFGIAHLDEPERRADADAPLSASSAEPPIEAEPREEAQPKEAEAREHDEAAPLAAPTPPFSDNVVALRRSRTALQDIGAGADSEAAPALNATERVAFEEIARALGARFGRPGEDDASAQAARPQPALEQSADAQTEAPGDAGPVVDSALAHAVAAADADLSLLQRSPFALLVSRGDEALWFNDALLALVGCVSAEQFREAGGLAGMMRGQPAPEPERGDVADAQIVERCGNLVSVEMASHAVAWRGEPAVMTLICRSERSESARVKSLEAELRRSDAEARELHSILDTATDGVAVLDEDGRLLSLNRAGEALFGYDQNEVAGQGFTSLLAPESHDAALDYFSQVASNGVGSLLNDGREIIGRARRGGAIPIFMTLGRVNAGGASKFCAVLRDMTAWKKVERELCEARSEAERASALKSDFLAKVSHEIRTPLNAILGFAEVIMDERFGPVGNERYRDYLKDIHASGTHVMSLVNDLLDLSKIEAGKMELKFDTVDANKIVAECVSIMQPQANSERVIVRLSTAPHLPHIVADERSLRQIVLNLLSNAVKFNEPGGQVIVSTALTDAGHAVIRIRDTGIGMSDSELITALEPFRQVQTSRQTTGTGLGLPLTKALVEANRASFTVKSKKAEGTLVEVAFPPARVMMAQ